MVFHENYSALTGAVPDGQLMLPAATEAAAVSGVAIEKG